MLRFTVSLIILGLVGCATSPDTASIPTPPPTPTPTPTPQAVATPEPPPTPVWKPTGDGWRSQSDQDGRPVYFRKITTGDCGIYDYCLNYQVTTAQGCRTLYVQASSTNEAGQNVDWTNDTVQGLRPKETGVISLGATESGSFRLDEVNCR